MIGTYLLYNPLRVVDAIASVASWSVGIVVAAWDKLPKPKSTFWKCVVYPIYGYVVIPGSMPYAFFKAAEFAGYGQEMDHLWSVWMNAFGSLGWLAMDAVIKGAGAALWFLLTAISPL